MRNLTLYAAIVPEAIPKGVKPVYVFMPKTIYPETDNIPLDWDGYIMNDGGSIEATWGRLHNFLDEWDMNQALSEADYLHQKYPNAKIGHYQFAAGTFEPKRVKYFATALSNCDVSFPSLYLSHPGEDKTWIRDSLIESMKLHPNVIPVVSNRYEGNSASPHYLTLLTPEDEAEVRQIVTDVRVRAWGRERRINAIVCWFYTHWESIKYTPTGVALAKEEVTNWKKRWR